MFRMYLNRFLYPFEFIVFGVTFRFWQLRSNSTGKSSHFLIYLYVWTPWGSSEQFVTECHHRSSNPYVPGNVLVSIRTKGFWCNTLILAVVPVHNRKSSNFLVQPYARTLWGSSRPFVNFLVQPYARTLWGSSRPFVTECHHNSSIPYDQEMFL